jgi:hypothetical protein
VLNGEHIQYLTEVFRNVRGDFGATPWSAKGKTATCTLKRRDAQPPGAADYGLLLALGLLALTRMLTLLLRATPAYGLVLVAHVATIVVCFAVLPDTRFVHAVYCFLAIVADNIERRRPG